MFNFLSALRQRPFGRKPQPCRSVRGNRARPCLELLEVRSCPSSNQVVLDLPWNQVSETRGFTSLNSSYQDEIVGGNSQGPSGLAGEARWSVSLPGQPVAFQMEWIRPPWYGMG